MFTLFSKTNKSFVKKGRKSSREEGGKCFPPLCCFPGRFRLVFCTRSDRIERRAMTARTLRASSAPTTCCKRKGGRNRWRESTVKEVQGIQPRRVRQQTERTWRRTFSSPGGVAGHVWVFVQAPVGMLKRRPWPSTASRVRFVYTIARETITTMACSWWDETNDLTRTVTDHVDKSELRKKDVFKEKRTPLRCFMENKQYVACSISCFAGARIQHTRVWFSPVRDVREVCGSWRLMKKKNKQHTLEVKKTPLKNQTLQHYLYSVLVLSIYVHRLVYERQRERYTK